MFGFGWKNTETRIRSENSQISSNTIISLWFKIVFKQEGFYSAFNYSSILIQNFGKAFVNEKAWAQAETQEVLSEHQENLFYCTGDQALAQITQRGCEASNS